MPDEGLQAVIVEAHPVDERAVGGQAKEARARVAGLWPGRYGAYFDEAEAQSRQCPDVFSVFVKTGGDSYRIGEADTGYGEGRTSVQASAQQGFSAGNVQQQFQQGQRYGVRFFGRK